MFFISAKFFNFYTNTSLMLQDKSYNTLKTQSLMGLMVMDISFVLLASQACVLCLYCFSSSKWRHVFYREMRSWWGLLTDDARISTTYTMMKKGLCTELVYTMLYVITNHTAGEAKDSYKDYDFTNEYKFTLENLFVKDPTQFET